MGDEQTGRLGAPVDASRNATHGDASCFEGAVQSLELPILIIADDGRVLCASPAAVRLLGVDDLAGRPVLEALESFDTAEVQAMLEQAACSTGPVEREMRRRDGRQYWLRTGARPSEAARPGTVAMMLTEAASKAPVDLLPRSTGRGSGRGLRTLTASLLAAQERERRNISRDLHEDLNQKLALLAVEFDALSQGLALQPPDVLRDRIVGLRGQLNEVSDRLRRIAYELHPTVLEHLGLAVGLRALCEDYASKGMHIRLRHTSLPDSMPIEVSLCIYRVLQEVLASSFARGSDSVTIVLAGAGAGVTVSVTQGAMPDGAQHNGQAELGLLSIAERVRLVQGSLSCRSRPQGGSRLIIRIPVVEKDTTT